MVRAPSPSMDLRRSDTCVRDEHVGCNIVLAAFSGDPPRVVTCECWCHQISPEDIQAAQTEILEILRDNAQVLMRRGRS